MITASKSLMHFGYRPNKHVCSCGRHFGYGNLTAEERADRAKDMRRKLPKLMPAEMRAFLKDWEEHHNLSANYMHIPTQYRSPYVD